MQGAQTSDSLLRFVPLGRRGVVLPHTLDPTQVSTPYNQLHTAAKVFEIH